MMNGHFLSRMRMVRTLEARDSGMQIRWIWGWYHSRIKIQQINSTIIPTFLSTNQSIACNTRFSQLKKGHRRRKMKYFVIGVSGVTCGGKTTLAKLLQRSFPWCRTVHQDSYFYDDDNPSHQRIPELENHVNYEILQSLDMPKMCDEVKKILEGPSEFFDGRLDGIKLPESQGSVNSGLEDTPNFGEGLELLRTVQSIEFDASKYKDIPVLLIEGFTIFESQYLFDQCDVRFFLTLDEDECRGRRNTRTYNPSDCPGYFEKCIWPEYVKHFNRYIDKRPGMKVFSGSDSIQNIWTHSVEIVSCRMAEKYFLNEHKIGDLA